VKGRAVTPAADDLVRGRPRGPLELPVMPMRAFTLFPRWVTPAQPRCAAAKAAGHPLLARDVLGGPACKLAGLRPPVSCIGCMRRTGLQRSAANGNVVSRLVAPARRQPKRRAPGGAPGDGGDGGADTPSVPVDVRSDVQRVGAFNGLSE
jgi:hypothetical protein